MRVPAAVGDFMMLDAIRASGGMAIAGRGGRIREWMQLGMPQRRALAICPEDGRLHRRAGEAARARLDQAATSAS